MLGLVVGIAYTTYIVKYHFGGGACHCFGGREVMKKGWCDKIYPFVGTLSAEDNCYQQYEWIALIQFSFGYGHGLLEVGDDFIV